MPLALLIFRSSAALLSVSPAARRTKAVEEQEPRGVVTAVGATRARPGTRVVSGGGAVTAVGE